MRQIGWAAVASTLILFGGGCATGPLQENPVLVGAQPNQPIENPVFLPQGPSSYNIVFSKVLDVVSDYFEIAYSERYTGQIVTQPKIAPGLGEPWKPGSPDLYQRTYATFQTVRHRAVVQLSTANNGGYFVDVKIFKELEDLDKPTQATAGAASFRSLTTFERQYEVVDSSTYESNWIPIGRDLKLEQVILDRIAHFDLNPRNPTISDPPALAR